MSELQRAVRTLSSRARDRVVSPEDPADSRPVSISARLGCLQFHESGKFRVLQIADVQAGGTVSRDTVRLLSAAIGVARPDLVVFTGNQIAGYDQVFEATFRKRRWSSGWSRSRTSRPSSQQRADAHVRDVVRDTIARFVAPVVEAGVPWAVTYGNHDFQCGLDNAQMDEIYRAFPGCVNPPPARSRGGQDEVSPYAGPEGADSGDGQGNAMLCGASSGLPNQTVYAYAPGTFALPVRDISRSRTVLGLLIVDSGDYARSGGYGSPSAGAVAFIAGSRSLVGAPSMLFQHMAVPQYYRLLKEVPATVDGAIEGYRAFAGRHYVLDADRTLPGGYLGEGISCPDGDSGEFEAMTADGACFAMACGHDHRNGFVGDVGGVALMATPTCGFDSYGPAPSQVAVRLVEFDIRHPHHPRTQLLSFGNLVGKASSTRKTYTYALNDVKASSGETIDLLHRPGRVVRVLRALGIR
ncbi:metallophosphoesterase [uncultured Bifidobacterium sp.]|uniref:metallophosphoesterase n=1 Tax=uncultured Bifidobacterium sp. TaxID=165187 RepID=UPI002625EFD8|nr:metallophosphoesterase [uncultured Bifidobacterium sp.]